MLNLSVKPIYNYGERIAKRVFNSLPSIEFKNGKVLNGIKWAGQHISSPQNRVILGATALLSQPFIDLHNRNVDQETRKVSAARTIAKIIAGTTTGFLVRYYTIKAVDAFTHDPTKAKKALQSILFPKKIAHTTIKGMQQYRLAIGTFLSLGVMMFTNFAIDAPLTKFLTNLFVKKANDYEQKKLDKKINEHKTSDKISEEKSINKPPAPFFTPPSIDTFSNRKEGK